MLETISGSVEDFMGVVPVKNRESILATLAETFESDREERMFEELGLIEYTVEGV